MREYGPFVRLLLRVGRCGLVVLIALGLSGCLFSATPAPPTLTRVPPTPTPLPTPTEQSRVALPTATPPPTVGPAPAPTPTPIPELRGAGLLTYVDTLGRSPGVFVVAADGTGRRPLAPFESGSYFNAGAWSPDGQRFALALRRANETSRVDLLTADGRLLRRHDFAGTAARIEWAADSGRFAVSVADSAAARTNMEQPTISAWIVDEGSAEPVEISLGKQTYPLAWSVGGRLALHVAPIGETATRENPIQRQELWTVDRSGGDARRVAEGHHQDVGWSADGGTLFALSDLEQQMIEGRPYYRHTSLVAIEERTGARRTLATLDALLPQLAGDGREHPSATFVRILVAPRSGRFAIWFFSDQPTSGTPVAAPPELLVLDADGRVIEWVVGGTKGFPFAAAWSPDGSRLAYSYQQDDRARQEGIGVLAFGANGESATALTIAQGDGTGSDNPAIAWSPDGRWLAFNRRGQIEVADTAGATSERRWVVGPAGVASARLIGWRP